MTSGDPIIDLDELLNPGEQEQFRRLCLTTSPEELAELGAVVELHLHHVRDKAGPNTDLDMAERLARSLCQLLDGEPRFDVDERALIRGAVEYFLMTDDASDDLDDPIGFDDDARVLNSVLDRVGRPDLRIELG